MKRFAFMPFSLQDEDEMERSRDSDSDSSEELVGSGISRTLEATKRVSETPGDLENEAFHIKQPIMYLRPPLPRMKRKLAESTDVCSGTDSIKFLYHVLLYVYMQLHVHVYLPVI